MALDAGLRGCSNVSQGGNDCSTLSEGAMPLDVNDGAHLLHGPAPLREFAREWLADENPDAKLIEARN